MAIDLSDEQRLALEQGTAVEVHDGARTYYVISPDQFHKLRLLLEVEQADPSFFEAGDIHLYND